jgi:ribonucleotide reductase beta subunit family protein with ferritin-like domain
MKTVFNTNKVDFIKEPMFLGENLNSQRYDVQKYPIFEKINNIMLGYYWRPEEVSLQKDRGDFLQFRPEQKFIFTKNLASQIVMDSIQGRSPTAVLAPYCSLPELEGAIGTWAFFENIHSRSYTHIIRNLYPNPSEIFDKHVMDDPMIINRAKSLSKYYDDFHNTANNYFIKGIGTLTDVKKKLVLAIYSANALEGIRFYLSFACTFAFAEQKTVEGSAKIISLIARDESQHLAITQNIIKNWQRGDDEEITNDILTLPEIKEECTEIFLSTVSEEKEFGKYLFSEGSIIGLNERLGDLYLEFIAGRRMKTIGLKGPYEKRENPLPWTQHWLSSSTVQTAAQETELESYIVGAINPDISPTKFANYSL